MNENSPSVLRKSRSSRACRSAFALLSLCSGIYSAGALRAADLFPFVLPWDDATPSVTDVSAWNEKPAGKAGFVVVKDGHLYAGGKRFRIFGVNCAFGANFPTHADAEKVAARMAKFGINCVRFHHMDMQSAPSGIWAADMRTLDPGQLDKLDWFIAKLKEHGIYADLNLHVSRTYHDLPASDKKGNPSYDKGVDNFSAKIIEEQKEYARALLQHVNPYTGNAYIQEPAVALIEINNENALLFEWWTGGLDKISAPYRAELTQLWNHWLKKKYPNDESLRAAWSAGAHAAGSELLKNGDLVQRLEGWYLEKHEGAEAVAAGAADGSAHVMRVEVQKPGHEEWHVQIGQGGLKLKSGESYTLTFRAKSDAARSGRVGASQAHEPWSVFGSKELDLGSDWKPFSFSFVAKQDDANARVSFSFGQHPGVYEIADLHLAVSRVNGDATRDAAGLIPSFTRDEYANRTPVAQQDWYQFLWSLEEAYWPGMYHFLKDDLKAKPLVLGTQMFWSPFPIQAQLDVIDSHAYWQHPSFPHRQWDMNDWSVKNVSMAGASDGGTLARLATQRVAGKPYICSEYNHASPNTYSAECFPLICAFAAMQDWDGIFAFAYSHRTDDWGKGYVPSFFDIDQHPLKMATLPGAMATWLRGDVSPAAGQHFAVLNAQQVMDRARTGGPRVAADQFGVTTQEALTKRVGVAPDFMAGLDDRAAFVEKPASTKPEFLWDTSNRCVTIDTPKSKAVIGHLGGRAFDLGDVTVVSGTTLLDWAVIQLTVLDGADFKSARRILITATGYTENTGMKWHDDAKTTVGTDWGHAPSQVEGVAATIKLPIVSKAKAWALDERGQRRAEIPLKDGSITIGPDAKSLWYEVSAE